MVFVTGGAGFIGSNFILDWFAHHDEPLVNIDKLTYAGNLHNLASLEDNTHYVFVRADIIDTKVLETLFNQYHPRAVIHFAAESHVDRSISGPQAFVETNIQGTFSLLEASCAYWKNLTGEAKKNFRFLHISTDEVYGSLNPEDSPFTETTPYAPNSPYAASKAASDHLVRAYHHTYGLPTLITNCSNNYGPYQFPEKLIPLVIYNALNGKPIPVYGDGLNIRDWLYVTDHCSAVRTVLERGVPGEQYNIGGWNEKTNIEVIKIICVVLDELKPADKPYASLINFIKDRPGHDRRYAINASKIKQKLGWEPKEQFEQAIRKTVDWYLNNSAWIEKILTGEYQGWVNKHYQTMEN